MPLPSPAPRGIRERRGHRVTLVGLKALKAIRAPKALTAAKALKG